MADPSSTHVELQAVAAPRSAGGRAERRSAAQRSSAGSTRAAAGGGRRAATPNPAAGRSGGRHRRPMTKFQNNGGRARMAGRGRRFQPKRDARATGAGDRGGGRECGGEALGEVNACREATACKRMA